MADHEFEVAYRGYRVPGGTHWESFARGVDAVLSADHDGNPIDPIESSVTYWMDNDQPGYRWFWRHRSSTDIAEWVDEAASAPRWRKSRRGPEELDSAGGVSKVTADEVPSKVLHAGVHIDG